MDRKTLEYMEERTKKARDIVNRIESLKKAKESLVAVIGTVTFVPELNCENKIRSSHFGKRLLSNIREALQVELEHEIELLEQELAEL